MVPEAAFVANPDFVDLLVLTGHHALDNRHAVEVTIRTGGQADVATNRAVRANAGHFGQFPGPRPKTEVGGGQRTRRTNVGCIAAEISVEWRVTGCHNLQTATTLVEG